MVLSSSAKEEHSDIEADAPNVTMPALFAFSRADQTDLDAVQSQMKNMPAKKKEFLVYDSGHGYTLLHDVTTLEFTALATAKVVQDKLTPPPRRPVGLLQLRRRRR